LQRSKISNILKSGEWTNGFDASTNEWCWEEFCFSTEAEYKEEAAKEGCLTPPGTAGAVAPTVPGVAPAVNNVI
jgi:hypothetical protein